MQTNLGQTGLVQLPMPEETRLQDFGAAFLLLVLLLVQTNIFIKACRTRQISATHHSTERNYTMCLVARVGLHVRALTCIFAPAQLPQIEPNIWKSIDKDTAYRQANGQLRETATDYSH